MLQRDFIRHGTIYHRRLRPCSLPRFPNHALGLSHARRAIIVSPGPLNGWRRRLASYSAKNGSIQRSSDTSAHPPATYTSSLNANSPSVQESFRQAYKDGILEVKPEQISSFVQELLHSGEELTAVALRNACAKQRISIDAAYTLARLMVQSPGQLDKFRGRQILLRAAELGSTKAALHIVRTAMNSNQLDKQEVQPPLLQLEHLSRREPPVIPALVLQGKISEAEQNFAAAKRSYARAIEHVSPPKKTLRRRLVEGLRSRYGPESTDMNEEQKITVDDNDHELDIASAHVCLGRVQYSMGEDDEAVRNWNIAALEYDDPNAFFQLSMHLEKTARQKHIDQYDPDDPIDHSWMRFVPYTWLEYALKAAVSGHAEACYKVGLFYMLDLRNLTTQIVDAKLRHALHRSPLMHPTPGSLYKARIKDVDENKVDTIYRWFMCAGKAGFNPGYLLAQLVHIDPLSGTGEPGLEIIESVAFGQSTSDSVLGEVNWTVDDQQLAQRLVSLPRKPWEW